VLLSSGLARLVLQRVSLSAFLGIGTWDCFWVNSNKGRSTRSNLWEMFYKL